MSINLEWESVAYIEMVDSTESPIKRVYEIGFYDSEEYGIHIKLKIDLSIANLKKMINLRERDSNE